jgi:hypothetical protein
MRAVIFLALAITFTVLVPPSFGETEPVPDPGFTVYAAPSALSQVRNAGEPSIGADWTTGSVFFQAYTQTYRVRFDDALSPPAPAWENVGFGAHTLLNIDPILFTDSQMGVTYAGGLDGECSILGMSSDDGDTWLPMGNACASPSFDHETIGAGPWKEPRPLTATSDRVVYYCAQLTIAQCAVSHNGGLTFLPAVHVNCSGVMPGLHGSVHVGPDGYGYLPVRSCSGTTGVSVTKDNGLKWQGAAVPGLVAPPDGFDPDVATTPSGWVWLGHTTRDWGAGVALSKNHGDDWIKFGDVGAAAGVKTVSFTEMVAGDDGRAAVVYLGSTTDGNPHDAAFAGTWDLYATFTHDEGATWQTVKITSDPVQRGWICAAGIDCGSGRNLLDFIDATVDSDGRVVIGFADGCVGACAGPAGTKAQSTSSYATIARQTCGRGLFEAVGTLNGGAPCPT